MKEVDLLLGFQTRAPWQVLSMSLLLSNIEASELLQSAPSMYTDMMHFKNSVGHVQISKISKILPFILASGHSNYNYIKAINLSLQDRHWEGHQSSSILHWAVYKWDRPTFTTLQLLQAAP